eukprot:scaffold44188_cov19-Tisochrysis_lutea.AAC.1
MRRCNMHTLTITFLPGPHCEGSCTPPVTPGLIRLLSSTPLMQHMKHTCRSWAHQAFECATRPGSSRSDHQPPLPSRLRLQASWVGQYSELLIGGSFPS